MPRMIPKNNRMWLSPSRRTPTRWGQWSCVGLEPQTPEASHIPQLRLDASAISEKLQPTMSLNIRS
jgi:hypothetical protein